MFFKKKLKNTRYFVFNYGCSDPQKCISLSVDKDLICGEWYDTKGNHYLYRDVKATDEFWDLLYSVVKEQGLFEWKAYKLFNRFASEVRLEVFNGEGLFQNGERFEANNMHGLPEGFEEGADALTNAFYSFIESK